MLQLILTEVGEKEGVKSFITLIPEVKIVEERINYFLTFLHQNSKFNCKTKLSKGATMEFFFSNDHFFQCKS
jgi:hypothetical protein